MNKIILTSKFLILLLLTCILQCSFNNAIAQDNLDEVFPVIETFRSTQLINAQTVEMLQTGGFEFKIQHRFGEIGFDERFYKEFLGLALPANIRLALAFPLTERFYTGIGWTKFKKTVDIENKFLVLRQTEENEIPVSVAFYFDIGIVTRQFSKIPENAFFSDSTTVFENKFAHRINYNTQIIIARKFTERVSFQIAPVLLYKNLEEVGKKNYTYVLPVSGRFKYSDNSSIIFEYAYIFNKPSGDFRDPLSIGLEIATSGHAFQIIMSSSYNILEQDIYTNKSTDYFNNNFHLGFNIKRMLFF